MNIVITGASSGIGLEMARQLSARGENVFVVCRKKSAELEKLKLTLIEGIELIEDLSLKNSGEFLHCKGENLNWSGCDV